MSSKIIFVDDEMNVLKALKRDMFLADIEAEYFISAKDAMNYMKQHPVDIVISDLNMPEMDGITFLEKILKNYPDVYRVILSSEGEENSKLKQAMQNRIAEQCFAKPWNVDELLAYFERFNNYAQHTVV